jgi:hypothetical protein
MQSFRELSECLNDLGMPSFTRDSVLANYKIQYMRTWSSEEVSKFHLMCRREFLWSPCKKFKPMARKLAERSLRVIIERVCDGKERKQDTRYDTGLAKATA